MISKLFITFAAITTLAAHAQETPGDFNVLLSEIKQWQRDNPNSCGSDTSDCAFNRLVDQFDSTCGGGGTTNAFRVVNGCPITRASTTGWSVSVAIGSARALCSGTLVSPRHVVLAGHCVKGYRKLTSFQVFVGSLNAFSATPSQTYNISAFAHHPNFFSLDIESDMAIIKLNRDIPFSSADSGARPACMPDSPGRRGLTSCVVAGYGVNNTLDPFSSGTGHLRYTVMSILDDAKCVHTDGKPILYEHQNAFCASGRRAGALTDTCNGDSGAGFMCKRQDGRWALQGVVSFGSKVCGTESGVYADVYALGLHQDSGYQTLSGKTAAVSTRCSSSSSSINNNNNFPVVIATSPATSFNSNKPASSIVATQASPVFFPSATGSSVLSSLLKPGGLASTLSGTVAAGSCSSGSECATSVCKTTQLCKANSIPPPPSSSASNVFWRLLPRIMKRLQSKQQQQDSRDEKIGTFSDFKMCSQYLLCWPQSWISLYSNFIPTFDV